MNAMVWAIKAQWRQGGVAMPWLFFIVWAVLFALGTHAESSVLHASAPAVLVGGAMLSVLMDLNRLFERDYEDGSLARLLAQEVSLSRYVWSQLLAMCIVVVLPLVVIMPVIAVIFQLSTASVWMSLMVGSLALPTMIFIGASVSALTLGLRQNTGLLLVLLLPLLTPVMIFSTQVISLTEIQANNQAPLYVLVALAMMSTLLGPWACMKALKIKGEQL